MKFTKLFTATVLGLLLLVGLQSCDLTEYNDNPNEPSEVPSSVLLPKAQQDAMDLLYEMDGLNGYIGNLWVQHYAKIQYTEEDRYDFSGRIGLVESLWEDFYSGILADLNTIKLQAQNGEHADNDMNANQEAIANIMMAWNYQLITDVWGPIPFSEALSGSEGISSPKYDSQEAVYDGIITLLDDAIGKIVPGKSPFGGQDLIYGGDMNQWLKLAHSLKLRVYIRQAEVAPQKAAAGIQGVISDDMYFKSNNDNAQLNYISYPDNNPINQFFGYEDGGREDHKVSKTLIDTLKGLNDPRLRVYAMPTEADSVWNWSDSELQNYPNHQWPDSTYVGVINGSENNYIPLNEASNIGAYYLAPNSPGFIMSYAEVRFIIAEAQARGWLTATETGMTETQAYEAAVRASMDMYNSDRLNAVIGTFPGDPAYTNQNMRAVELPVGISEDEIDDYLSGEGAYPITGTTNDKLDWIAFQKWTALFHQPLESWSEWRRSGQPMLEPGPLAVLNQVPVRVFYPPIEQSVNQSNYNAAVDMIGGNDNMTSPLWWDTE